MTIFSELSKRDVALAYQRIGNPDRFDQAMQLDDKRTSSFADQGIENFAFSGNRAVHYALLGDKEAAFAQLQLAVDDGWEAYGPLEEAVPAFSILADDPCFAEIEAEMLQAFNANRAIVGLPPFNADYQVELEH